MHITWPQLFPEPTKEMNCSDEVFRKHAERPCKYLGLEFYMDTIIGTKQYKAGMDFDALFIEEKNGCQQVMMGMSKLISRWECFQFFSSRFTCILLSYFVVP